MGGPGNNVGAWVFIRSGGAWTLQGSELVGTGAVGQSDQGVSVALSADGNTALVGGGYDNYNSSSGSSGAVWVFVRPVLQVTPATGIVASGNQGGTFSPTSFQYQLTSTVGSVNYTISGIPTWLNANFTAGAAITTPVTVTFSLMNVGNLKPGTYSATISFTNTTNGQGNTARTATLTVNPRMTKPPPPPPHGPPPPPPHGPPPP